MAEPVDAYALASVIGVTAATVRKWASRGKIIATGDKDTHGRALYDPDEVLSYAAGLGYGTAHSGGSCPPSDRVSHCGHT